MPIPALVDPKIMAHASWSSPSLTFSINKPASRENQSILDRRLDLNSEFLAAAHKKSALSMRLSEVGCIGDNWDSYGSEGPNDITISGAAQVLDLLRAQMLNGVDIFPAARGGIAFTFSQNERFAQLELLNNGLAIAALEKHRGAPEVSAFSPTRVALLRSLAEIRKFLSE